MKTLQFWIEYGSTYTYLTVARIGRMAKERGIPVEWQPFYLMPIMIEQGMNQGPFLPYPIKTEYMWRDIERRAQRAGIPYTRPSTYPVNSMLTARIACIAADEGWCQPFTESVFRLHWTRNTLIGSDENLETALSDLGKDVSELKERAQTPVGSSRVDLQACKLEYSIVSPK